MTQTPKTRTRTPGAPSATLNGMNVVMFMTDQERYIQHFPPGWAKRNLPGLNQLMSHGLTFDNATTNACMCSPARSTLMSGFFPAQHGVRYTLEESMPASTYPQVPLPGPTEMANLATVMSAAGYTVVYKGKWHCSKPAGSTWSPADLSAYGFSRWNPQDAGANQSLPEMGAGIAQNDARYMASTGDVAGGDEGVLQFINSIAATMQPFFLIVSLVNPHDVLAYPKTCSQAGFSDNWLDGEIGLPKTVAEDLSTKPTAQRAFLKITQLMGPLKTREQKLAYLNFYGNLMKASDQHLVQVIAALKSISTGKKSSMFDNTLMIRTADHGEMGLAHGGLRQKNFNMYDESLRVPLVFSNPTLFKKPRSTKALVSHVDLLPTLAGLFTAPASACAAWEGRDYSSIVLNAKAEPVQDYVIFTYDDFQAGQPTGPYVPPPQHIVGIREARWKIAQYFDPTGTARTQWEMYDLQKDPLETNNIAHPSRTRTTSEESQFTRLKKKLADVQAARLQPLPTTVEWTATT